MKINNECETQPQIPSRPRSIPVAFSIPPHLDAVAGGALHPSYPRFSLCRPGFCPPGHVQQPLLRRVTEVSLLVRPEKRSSTTKNENSKLNQMFTPHVYTPCFAAKLSNDEINDPSWTIRVDSMRVINTGLSLLAAYYDIVSATLCPLEFPPLISLSNCKPRNIKFHKVMIS